MKKSIVYLSLLAIVMPLMACNGSTGKDHFKEYEFVNSANSEQSLLIQEGLKKNALEISSITSKVEAFAKRGFSEASQEYETTEKYYDDPSNPNLYICESTASGYVSSEAEGIKLKQNGTVEYTEWDKGNGYRFTVTKNKVNGKSESDEDAITQANDPLEYKTSRLLNAVSLPSSSTFYINKDGTYTVISSSIDKSVSAVEWGNGTKEHITSSKRQVVYKISKDYRLTHYYYYEEQQTNRDPDTGEWYKSTKVISRSYESKEYKYGQRATKSISSYDSLIADKSFFISATLSSYTYTATVEEKGYSFVDTLEIRDGISLSNSSTSGNIRKFYFQDSFAATYSETTLTAKKYTLSVVSLKNGGVLSTDIYPIKKADTFSNGSIEYFDAVQNGSDFFIINKYYYTSTARIYITFDGNNAVIDTVVQW